MATTTMHQPQPMLVPDIVPMSPPDSSTNGHIYTAQDGDKGSVRVKRISKSKGLQRSDSDKSNKSHTSLGAMSFMNYDPKNEGSLARDAEITVSMYDVYDDTGAAVMHVNGEGGEVRKQRRRSSSGQTPGFFSGRRISQTSQASVKSWSSGNVGVVGANTAGPVQEEENTPTKTTATTSTVIQQNGRHSPEEQGVRDGRGENMDYESSVRTSTHYETAPTGVDMLNNGSVEVSQVRELMTSAQDDRRDVVSGAEGGSAEVQLFSPPQGFEDERNPSPSLTPLEGTSAASTLTREVKPAASKAVSKVGSFTMKPASNLQEETTVNVPAPSSQFKSSLEDTMKRIVQERNGASSGEGSRERSKASTPALSRASSVSKHGSEMAIATERREETKKKKVPTATLR